MFVLNCVSFDPKSIFPCARGTRTFLACVCAYVLVCARTPAFVSVCALICVCVCVVCAGNARVGAGSSRII